MRTLPLAILFITGLLATGCSKTSKPSKAEIEKALTIALPAYVQLDSLTLEVQENLGNDVEPNWATRFHGTVKMAVDTFVPDGNEVPDIFFLRRVKHAGETVEVFGKSLSSLQNRAWHTQFYFDDQLQSLGTPQSAFGIGHLIVRGSSAEKDLAAEKTAAIAAKEQEVAWLAAARQRMLADAARKIVGKWGVAFLTIEFNRDSSYQWADSRLYRDSGRWSVDGERLRCVQTLHNGKSITPSESSWVIESISDGSVTLFDARNRNSKITLNRLQ